MYSLQRNAYQKLLAWKERTGRKKCLIVRGARQVGKTSLVEYFGESEYDNLVSVNFLKTPRLKSVFASDLVVKTLLLNFSVYLPDAVFEPGHTLLFLDEIQECPEAITSLKFWAEDGRFDIIASGSMLGIDYKRPTSYPVGSVEYLDMTSLSFPEFLRANGIRDEVMQLLRERFAGHEAVPLPIHERMMELLRQYLVVGGMPEAVTAYLEHNSIAAADDVQRRILEDYRYDIAHYAAADEKIKAESCYFSLPRQLGKENHKFQYSVVEKGSNARKYGSSVDWLVQADLAVKVCNVDPIAVPLADHADESNFRLYPTDIGLLTGMLDYSVKASLLDPHNDLLAPDTKGGLYEALVADMLYKNGHRRLYFSKNEQGSFELEFLLPESGAVPVEVKSGRSRSRSLDNLLKRQEIPYGYKLIDGNVGKADKKITLPLYMAMFL